MNLRRLVRREWAAIKGTFAETRQILGGGQRKLKPRDHVVIWLLALVCVLIFAGFWMLYDAEVALSPPKHP